MGVMNTEMPRRSFLAAAGGMAALALCPAGARGALRRLGAAPGTMLDWTPLRDGLWAVADLTLGGNTLVHADEGEALLIDTKFPYLAGALLRDTRALAGGEGAPITLVNTHHHADHTGGNAIVVPESTAHAHARALDRIGGQLARFRQTAAGGPGQLSRTGASRDLIELAATAADGAESWTEDDVVPGNTITDAGATLEVGSTRIEIHHFGAGHTDNDLVVHLPERGLVHTGDLVFNGTHPFYDPDGGVDARGWVAALKRVRGLCDPDTTVVPGHGPVGDRSIIDAMISYHERLIEEVQRAIEAGERREDVVERTWDFMEGLKFGSIRSRAIGVVYDQLAG